VFIQVCCR